MNQEQRDAASRLRADMAKLDALNLPPLTDDEIEDAVQESRRARRASRAVANRFRQLREFLVALIFLVLVELTCRWMLGRSLIVEPVLDVLRRVGGH
ncbi:MAG: hypothetical protein K0Q43_169 [Ramlibacter sp.]|jgi:hypothetical protein|nr:hypothetical protein [Ramlibacter sp.]